jgi:hypothetical protein
MKPHTEIRWAIIYTRPDKSQYFGGMLAWQKHGLPDNVGELYNGTPQRVQVSVTVIPEVKLPNHWGEILPDKAKKARRK